MLLMTFVIIACVRVWIYLVWDCVSASGRCVCVCVCIQPLASLLPALSYDADAVNFTQQTLLPKSV